MTTKPCNLEPRSYPSRLAIDLLALDLDACGRCSGTAANLNAALDSVGPLLRQAGVELAVRKMVVNSAEDAQRLRFETSPTIRINGRDIAAETRESSCQDCGELCGCNGQVNCRVWVWQGKEHLEAPTAMILDAIMTAQPPSDPSCPASRQPFQLPENLRDFSRQMRTSVCREQWLSSAAMKALAASLPPRLSAVASNRILPTAAANDDRGMANPFLSGGTQMNTTSQTLSAEFLNKLRTFVRRRVRTDADADDVVQDVLTKLVQHGSPPSGSVHAWLFTVARNAIIDRGRKRGNPGSLDVLELAETTPEPADKATEELASCLGPMISALPPDDQLVLTRIDLQGESQSDLAREYGLSTSGMKSRVQRARKRLRAVLESCCSFDRDTEG